MKIRQIIVLLFIVLSVCPMIFLGCIGVNYYNNKLERVLENDLKNTVSIQVEAILNFLDERRTEAAVISQLQIVADLLTSAERGGAEEARLRPFVEDSLLLRMENREFMESVTIIDKNFVILASSAVHTHGHDSILGKLDPKYLGPELTFSSVIEKEGSSGEAKRVIVGFQEIYVQGKLAGYLVIELNLSFFEKLRVSSELFQDGTVYLLDRDGGLITAGDTKESRKKFELSDTEQEGYKKAWEARDKSKDSGIIRYKARGNTYLSYYRDIQEEGWRMISSVNSDEILETQDGYKRLALTILVVLVFLLAGVNLIIARNLGSPIRSMVQKFQKIRETQDYSIRMEENLHNEIGIISVEINHLLLGIEEHIEREKQVQSKLRELADRDPLTGLYNKTAIGQILDRELKTADEKGEQVACVYVDIDNFKSFNTNYGHKGGDQVIRFVANALEECLNGFVGRQGGDEFLACIPDAGNGELVEASLKKLMELLENGVVLEGTGKKVMLTLSAGIAFSDKTTGSAVLVERADKAMYRVKEGQKNGYCIWGRSRETDCAETDGSGTVH